jgi:hypothetical protein
LHPTNKVVVPTEIVKKEFHTNDEIEGIQPFSAWDMHL